MSAALEALCRRFGGHQPGLLGARHEFAVLCPLVEQPDGLHFLFEVRAAGLSQGGEVCFPGGKREPGETPAETALRETEEELSIPRREIQLLGTPDFLCTQRSSLLRPYLGLISPVGLSALVPSPSEVAEVFTVPVSFFRDTPPQLYSYELIPHPPADFPYEEVGISRDYPWTRGKVDVPIWHWHNHVIWGMTARIVQNITREVP